MMKSWHGASRILPIRSRVWCEWKMMKQLRIIPPLITSCFVLLLSLPQLSIYRRGKDRKGKIFITLGGANIVQILNLRFHIYPIWYHRKRSHINNIFAAAFPRSTNFTRFLMRIYVEFFFFFLLIFREGKSSCSAEMGMLKMLFVDLEQLRMFYNFAQWRGCSCNFDKIFTLLLNIFKNL